jgi:hypothetical protein
MSEVVATTPVFSTTQLQEIKSFDDALALLANSGMELSSIKDYGDGFEVLDKSRFVNRKFIIIDYKIVDAEKSTYGTEFAVVRIVTVDGVKALLTDGSVKSGLCNQIMTLRDQGVTGGVMCEDGLIVSEYDYVDENGERTPAKTYYFSGM